MSGNKVPRLVLSHNLNIPMSKRFFAEIDDVVVKSESARAKKARVPYKSKMTVQQMVKKAVVKMAEPKSYQFTINTTILPYTGTGWAAVGLRPITPYSSGANIVGGTGQADRIGNKIRTKKVTLSMCMSSLPSNAVTNPSPQPNYITIWIFGLRESNALPNDLSGFFQNGNTVSDPQGTLADEVKTINTDKYIVYKKIVKKLGYSSYDTTGAAPTYQNFDNNDFSILHNVKMDLTKYCPTNVTWSDSANPTSKAVFIAIQAVPASGQQYTAPVVPAQMFYNLNYEFTDV